MTVWHYCGREVTEEDMVGFLTFVYRITNTISGKQYLGKKKLTTYRRKIVKGRKNRKKVVSPSDWRVYYGSNQDLKDDVKEYGEEHFHREIIRLCKSTGEASYYEAKYIFAEDAIKRPNEYYNQSIQCRIHRNHLGGKDAQRTQELEGKEETEDRQKDQTTIGL